MSHRRVLVAGLLFVFVFPSGARAQLDDLLAPLTPAPTQPEKKVRPKPKRRVPRSASPQAPAEKRSARLVIVPTPSDRPARLFVNGSDRGVVPSARPLELPAGTYSIEVRRSGYASFNQRVELSAGETRELVAQLIPAGGLLEIAANVPGADVYVDGVLIGRTPIRGWSLAAGAHELTVKKPGYRPETSALNVKPGREYNIQATLRTEAPAAPSVAAAPAAPAADDDIPLSIPDSRSSLSDVSTHDEGSELDALTGEPVGTAHRSVSRPLYKRWYFWAGVGAVALGAGLGGYALSRGGPSGPAPNDVCGGPCAATLNAQ